MKSKKNIWDTIIKAWLLWAVVGVGVGINYVEYMNRVHNELYFYGEDKFRISYYVLPWAHKSPIWQALISELAISIGVTLLMYTIIRCIILITKIQVSLGWIKTLTVLWVLLITILMLKGIYMINENTTESIYLYNLKVEKVWDYIWIFILSFSSVTYGALHKKYIKSISIYEGIKDILIKSEWLWKKTSTGINNLVLRNNKEVFWWDLYFTLHFLLLHLVRILSLIVFVQFVFFNGDLRPLLYLLPFFLLRFILLAFVFYTQHVFFIYVEIMFKMMKDLKTSEDNDLKLSAIKGNNDFFQFFMRLLVYEKYVTILDKLYTFIRCVLVIIIIGVYW